MNRTVGAGIVAFVSLLLAPPVAPAQQSGALTGWWEWALPEVVEAHGQVRDGVWAPLPLPDRREDRGDARDRRARDRDRRGPDFQRGSAAGARGGGPPFCRNGEGHPVFGMSWCREKGFGVGRASRWEPVSWRDVILRVPERQRRDRTLRNRDLIDILGDVVLGRIIAEGGTAGTREPVTGRWLQPDRSRGMVLQIRAGGVPLAELTDLNGDGRADAVLLHRDFR